MKVHLRVVHISTVHRAGDVRILYRECASLADSMYNVTLIAKSQIGLSHKKVRIISLPAFRNRFFRIVFGGLYAICILVRLRPQIVHFHDPELIPWMFIVKVLGSHVVYDVHENLRKGLYEKKWIPFKRLLLPIFFFIEKFFTKRFHFVFAEDSYKKYYSDYGLSQTTVFNYPDLRFFRKYRQIERPSDLRLFYVGGVSVERGILVILEAIFLLKNMGVKIWFDCVGPADEGLKTNSRFQELKNLLTNEVKFHGQRSLEEAYEISKNSSIGLCILQPIANYIESQPTKIFEYMAVGLPVIASDFPLYHEIIADAGVCIEPKDSLILAETIKSMNVDVRNRMGEVGIKLAEEKYSWELEYLKLSKLYEILA